jgi:hypothetical protein
MGESCLARESVVRVALVVLLLACKIVFARKRGVVSAGAACNLGGSALPTDNGVHEDAAPANGVHGDAAPANSGVHWDAAPALGGRLVGRRPSSARLAGSLVLRPPLAALVSRRGLPPLASLSSKSSSTRTLASALLYC